MWAVQNTLQYLQVQRTVSTTRGGLGASSLFSKVIAEIPKSNQCFILNNWNDLVELKKI